MKKCMCNNMLGQDDVLMTDSPKMASHNFDEQSDSDINLALVVSSGKLLSGTPVSLVQEVRLPLRRQLNLEKSVLQKIIVVLKKDL